LGDSQSNLIGRLPLSLETNAASPTLSSPLSASGWAWTITSITLEKIRSISRSLF
jgi:hypothetical protein